MNYSSFNKETELIIAKNKLANNVFNYKILDNFITINFLQKNGSLKGFKYSLSNVDIIINPTELSISDFSFVTKWNAKPLNNIKKILLFKDEYYKAYTIIFENDTYNSYFDSDLNTILNIANDKDVDLLKQYYIKIDEKTGIKTPEGTHILEKRLQDLSFINNESVLSSYLKSNVIKSDSTTTTNNFIFPFGSNLSQMKAVSNALTNNISVIEGPPGTGKTQTILNIIANIVSSGKSCAVVSNNNSATINVYEKLQKYGYGFICAPLGSSDNKKEFIEKKQTTIDKSFLSLNNENVDIETIGKLNKNISKQYKAQNKIAKNKVSLKEAEVEFKHFLNSINKDSLSDFDCDISDTYLMIFIKKLRQRQERKKKNGFLFKLFYRITYGRFTKKLFLLSDSLILDNLFNLYYISLIERLKFEIKEDTLLLVDFDKKKKELEVLSNNYLKEKLNNKFSKMLDHVFDESVFYKSQNEFLSRYPVILSTTYSISSSLKNIMYDYIIVDEASQVDLSTAFLSMCSTKNIVVVGDLMQLPNVITDKDKAIINELSLEFNIENSKRYEENSLLSSVIKSVPLVPRTLLKEHYRCHPKIINFCNKKFYNNELVIMTPDNDEPSVLRVIKTVEGNHARQFFNIREAEVVLEEAVPLLESSSKSSKDIGIICPYNEQKEYINKKLKDKPYAVCDTVHKFQGREKDDIIISTVDNELTKFTDNANMINVSVSRAKKHLILVTNHNISNKQSNVRDLVDYIKYNNFEVVDSKINSVFDLLYSGLCKDRRDYLKGSKQISEYDSENLIYKIIEELLKNEKFRSLNVIAHYPLQKLLIDNLSLTPSERAYAFHPNTHLDFIIYNKLSKSTVLAVEVDGYKYHKSGTVQSKRDEKKDIILAKYDIPLLRLSTTGSNEKQRIKNELNKILNI